MTASLSMTTCLDDDRKLGIRQGLGEDAEPRARGCRYLYSLDCLEEVFSETKRLGECEGIEEGPGGKALRTFWIL